jgi:hypothetical protein
MIKAGELNTTNNTITLTNAKSLNLVNSGSSEAIVLFDSSGDTIEIARDNSIKLGAFDSSFTDTISVSFSGNFSENSLQYIYTQ